MYEEDKTINFTTQNAILHYGRKGMKWGQNIFEDEPINSQYKKASGFDKAKQYAAYKAGKAYGSWKSSAPARAKAAAAVKSGAKKAGAATVRGAKAAGRMAKEAYSDYNDYMDEAIDAEVARKQAKNRDPEQKAKIDKMNSVSDETREQVRHVTSNLNEIEKYINAYKQGIESFGPAETKKREKFAEKFVEKYGSKIREYVNAANDGMSELENSGLEGFESNKMEFAIKGAKGIDVMANLEKSVNANKDQLKKKSKNVVYGDYK